MNDFLLKNENAQMFKAFNMLFGGAKDIETLAYDLTMKRMPHLLNQMFEVSAALLIFDRDAKHHYRKEYFRLGWLKPPCLDK